MRRHLLTAALVFATLPLVDELRPGRGSAVAQEADSALEQADERTPGATLPGETAPETGFDPTPVDPDEVDDDLRSGSRMPDARGTVGESTAPFPTTGDTRILESPDQDGVGGAGAIDTGPDPVIEPGVVDTEPGQAELPAAADALGFSDEPGVTDPQFGAGGSGIYEGASGAETQAEGSDEALGEGAGGAGAGDEEAPETGGFGGTEPQAGQAAGAQQQQMLEALRAQQQALIEQQQAFDERQAEIAERTAELEQLELERTEALEEARLARVQRIDHYGEVAELLIQSDTALIGGELDVGDLLDVATEELKAAEALALSQGRGVEAQLASGALAEILRASEALGRRDVYAARLALQESGVLLGEARLVARQQQPAAQ